MAATDYALSIFGFNEDDLGFVKLADFTPDFEEELEKESMLQSAFSTARATQEATSVMIAAPAGLGSNNNEVPFLRLKFIPQDDGSVYAFSSDCSQELEKLRVLEKAQSEVSKSSAEKTLFFAGVSHELRTPLNAIIGFSDMMRSRLFGPLPGKYAEYADLIHDSGQHMLDLIGDVLDMSKVEAGKYELQYDEFDIADVIRSSVKMLRPSADAGELSLATEIEADVDLFLEADRRAVRQILLNLLSNAIKFTPKGGRIVVTATQVQDVLNLSVEDNGMGMSESDLSKVGKAYGQASTAQMVDARGSGLGLALVKNLVELHNGRFTIKSHPGAGTSVNIYLPLKKTKF